jgi:hypothetical protein
VKAKTRRSTPVVLVGLGVHVLDACVRQHDRRALRARRTPTGFNRHPTPLTGANLSATRHAKMRREKLSMTAWR